MSGDVVELSFGEHLKSLREKKGVALQEVANDLKISTQLLRYMEAGDQQHFPERIYMKGYIRLLARLYGAEEQDLLIRYEALYGDATELPDAVRQVDEQASSSDLPMKGLTWGVVLLIVALVVTWWWQGADASGQAYQSVLKSELYEQHIMKSQQAQRESALHQG